MSELLEIYSMIFRFEKAVYEGRFEDADETLERLKTLYLEYKEKKK